MNPVVDNVTRRIRQRSERSRARYLEKLRRAGDRGPGRQHLSCGNLAHAAAGSGEGAKHCLFSDNSLSIGIVSAYNDMLSAHQPFERYPDLIRKAAGEFGAVAQFAGGVPAMCDGVTQGQDGMDLSLFSRDVIALSTAIALSHDTFDAVMCLGVCDKIVPGLLIGALSFGHLPCVFVPAGPMESGLSNKAKAEIRERFAAGEIGREELLAAESAAYHSPGTCTFYGTANSNQMMMEFLGLQLPGGSFVHPNTPLRDALTRAAVETSLQLSDPDGDGAPIGHIVDELAIVNAIVGLLATGGSTNHTLHLVAIAAAAGVRIDWSDFSELSGVVPLLARVYPNGQADVNQFHAAGGLGLVMGELLNAGLLHQEVNTILGPGLRRFLVEPFLAEEALEWRPATTRSLDPEIIRPADDPVQTEGGIRLVQGNLGRAIVKVSAVAEEFRNITAPARVFHSQPEFVDAFKAGELDRDFVAVISFQGARANGMPELHKLTPYLSLLQQRGHRVALLTDGRMSGASGTVLSAIQTTPEALADGAIGQLKDGDPITICADQGVFNVDITDADLRSREIPAPDLSANHAGVGRELFASFRKVVGSAETGATVLEVG